MKRLLSRLLPVVAGLLIAGSAQAQGTASADVTVQARVNAKCTINTGAVIDFGVYDPVDVNAAAAQPGSGTITVQCNKGSSFYVTFDAIAGNMVGDGASADLLPYTLWEDVGHTSAVRPDGTDDAASVLRRSSLANKNPVSLTVYGLIPMNQDVEVANYVDTVQATVNY